LTKRSIKESEKYNKSINTRTKIHLSVQFHLFRIGWMGGDWNGDNDSPHILGCCSINC